MVCEEQPCAVSQALSSDCGSGWYRQDDGGGGDDDDEKQEWLRYRSSVLGYHFVLLGDGDDGDGRVHDHGDGDDEQFSS